MPYYPPVLNVFCIWVFVLTILYTKDIIDFSPLYLSIGAILFTIPYNIFYIIKIKPFLYSLSIVLFEIGIAVLNFNKHILIDKKPCVSKSDIIFSILIFTLYLLFLFSINKTFYDVYFVDLLKHSQ
jgi:hypothetical protein